MPFDPSELHIILPNALEHAHALSFEHQPLLAALVEELQAAESPLLVVAGAGVSIDAGLRSWEGLLESIEQQHAPASIRSAMRRLQGDSIQRRGTVALALAGQNRPLGREYEVVRDALLPGAVPPAGPLAAAISRLIATYRAEVRLMTTNYDPILADAISNITRGSFAGPTAYSVDGPTRMEERRLSEEHDGSKQDFEAWIELTGDEARYSVMHLHGKVPVRDAEKPLFPLVLTEASYFSHGSRVVEKLVAAMTGRTTLFVGLSMTDPNVLAALQMCREYNIPGTRYSITVPPLYRPGLSVSESAEYACTVARTLRSSFSVHPIMLKTYSQVIQLVSDLALAIAAPERYRVSGSRKPTNLRYGVRMRTALRQVYDCFGAAGPAGKFDSEKLGDISRTLHREVGAPDGPAGIIRKKGRKYTGRVWPEESVALFVWLRDIRDLTRGNRGSFALRLIVSSAYHHWEQWSYLRVEPVAGDSVYAPVQAVFQGQPSATNLRPVDASGPWRGAYAIPLRLGGYGSKLEVEQEPLDQLLVGAVALNTTAYVEDDEVARSEPGRLSALSQMSSEEMDELNSSMYSVVQKMLAN